MDSQKESSTGWINLPLNAWGFFCVFVCLEFSPFWSSSIEKKERKKSSYCSSKENNS